MPFLWEQNGTGPDMVVYYFGSWRRFLEAAREPSRPQHALHDPVQQYLTQSGRTLFKGMRFEDLRRMQIDIETSLSADYAFSNPERDPLLAITLSDSTGWEEIIVVEAGSPDSEPAALKRLCSLIIERDPDVIEGHNIFKFDLPYLSARASKLGISLFMGRDGSLLSADSRPAKYFTTNQTATSDERRREFARIFRLGLVAYASDTSAASQLDVTFKRPPAAGEAAGKARDPWRRWVFQLSTNTSLSGEATSQYKSYRLNASASRVTDDWKVNVSASQNYNQNVFTLGDGEQVHEPHRKRQRQRARRQEPDRQVVVGHPRVVLDFELFEYRARARRLLGHRVRLLSLQRSESAKPDGAVHGGNYGLQVPGAHDLRQVRGDDSQPHAAARRSACGSRGARSARRRISSST